jgi:stress response protein YsnF
MNSPTAVTVTDPQGVHGTIDTAAWPLDGRRAEVLVQLESGRQVFVPVHLLVREEEGRYSLPMALADLEPHAGADPREPPLVLPVIEEALGMDTRPGETGRVRIRKVVTEREELVDLPLRREEVIIRRVPITLIVEESLPVRYEGDTMIIFLTEEVHMTTRRTETHTPERVSLRHKDVTLEWVDLERQEPHSQEQEESHGEDRDRTC